MAHSRRAGGGRSRGGKVALELELERRGTRSSTPRPITPDLRQGRASTSGPEALPPPAGPRPFSCPAAAAARHLPPSTATSSDLTEPWPGRPRWSSSTPASRPDPASPKHPPTTGLSRRNRLSGHGHPALPEQGAPHPDRRHSASRMTWISSLTCRLATTAARKATNSSLVWLATVLPITWPVWVSSAA